MLCAPHIIMEDERTEEVRKPRSGSLGTNPKEVFFHTGSFVLQLKSPLQVFQELSLEASTQPYRCVCSLASTLASTQKLGSFHLHVNAKSSRRGRSRGGCHGGAPHWETLVIIIRPNDDSWIVWGDQRRAEIISRSESRERRCSELAKHAQREGK